MNQRIYDEIQEAQRHGRQKYGSGPEYLEHDDRVHPEAWHRYIEDHNERAALSTPTDRRSHLIKLAGLAVSAIEAYDRMCDAKEIA